MILDKTQTLQDFSFVENNTPIGDVYLCSCGHKFNIENNNIELKKELAEANQAVSNIMSSDSDFAEEFGDLYKNVNLSMEEKIECPSCKKSFLKEENRRSLITKGFFFVSGFKLEESKDQVKFYYSKIKLDYKNNDFDFIEDYKYIKIEKNTNKLFFKDYYEEEREFDLDEIVKIVNIFLKTDTQVVHNAFDLHSFMHALTNLVIDRKNIDIANEMLEQIRSRHNDLGLDIIKKAVIVFLGIIKYTNLSTIAITKGPTFLYDMMVECEIPNPKTLSENQLTSPIKIFNFLAQNYVKDLGKDINLDNKDVQEFSFKSKKLLEFESDGVENEFATVSVKDTDVERTLNISVKNNINYKSGKVKDTGSGYGILEAVEDGSVSKFIFKNIKKFSDYKYIIKYFKIANKQEIILLMQKYDLEFLSHAIDLLYFRNKTDFKELQRILDIMLDYVESKNNLPTTKDGNQNHSKYDKLSKFEFIPYDDSLMMMTVLKFDKKRHFEKIKTWKELNEYHDNLIKYFKTIKDEEKNGDIASFVSQFSYLEDVKNYKGPIKFVILSTPAMIIREGVELKHSGASYAKNVASRTYLMGQIFDNDPNRPDDELIRYTIGFNFDKYKGLVFEQVKGFGNKTGSDRFKTLMMEWLTIKDISFQPIKDLKING